MSFDLYFVPKGIPWSEALDAIEQAAMSEETVEFTPDQLSQWERIVEGVAAAVPGTERFDGDQVRELNHHGTGMQLSAFPGEISLAVPYWHTDDDAVEVTKLLRTVAEIVERETGLVAYDPQADDGFLTAGAATAADTMTDVRHQMEEHLGSGATPDEPARAPWWRRLFGG